MFEIFKSGIWDCKDNFWWNTLWLSNTFYLLFLFGNKYSSFIKKYFGTNVIRTYTESSTIIIYIATFFRVIVIYNSKVCRLTKVSSVYIEIFMKIEKYDTDSVQNTVIWICNKKLIMLSNSAIKNKLYCQ